MFIVLEEQTNKLNSVSEQAMLQLANGKGSQLSGDEGVMGTKGWQKLLQLESQLSNLALKVDTQLVQQINDSKVKALIIDEINAHAKIVSENMKQNLAIQKKDYEGMLKRLGINIQEALMKIRDEMQNEYRDLIAQLEDKMNKNVKIITEDVNEFGSKWDNELQRFQVLMNKKIEENESTAHKEFAKLLDESMQAIEDSLNNNVII